MSRSNSKHPHPATHQKGGGGVGLAPLGNLDARSSKAGASPRNAVVVPMALFPPSGKGSSTGSVNTRPKSNQPPVRSRTPVQQNTGVPQARTPVSSNPIPRAPSTPPPQRNATNASGRTQPSTQEPTTTKPTPSRARQQSPQRARPTAQSQQQHVLSGGTPRRDQIMNLADYTTPSPLQKRTNALREKLDRFLSPQTPVQGGSSRGSIGGGGRYGGAPPATASSVASSSDGMTPSRRQQQEWLEILNYIDSVTIAVSSHNKSAPELPGKSLTGVGAGHIGTEMGAPISLVGSRAVVGSSSSSSPSAGNNNNKFGGKAPIRVKPSTIDASKYLATIQRHINGLLHWFSLLELKSLPRGSNTVSEVLRNQLLLSSDAIAAIGAAQAYILQEAGADGGTQLLQFMKLQIAPVVSECYDSICNLYGLAKGYGEIRQAVQERDGELALKVIRASKTTESRKNSKLSPPPSIKGPKASPMTSVSLSAQITTADSVASKLPTTPASYPPTLVEWLEMKWHPALEQWNSILITAKEAFTSPEADRDQIASTASKLKGDVLNDPINTSLFQELLLPGETLPKLVSEHITSPGDGAAMAASKKASLFKRLQGAISGGGKATDSGPNFVELASAVRALQEAYPEPSSTTSNTLENIRSNPTGCDPTKLSTSELKQVEDAQRLLLNIQHAGKATMALTIALNGGSGSIEQLIKAMTEANRIMLKLGVCGAGDGSKGSTARCLKAIQQGEDMVLALGRTNPDSVDGADQAGRHARRQQLADQRMAFLTAFSAGDLIVVHLPGSGWSPELTMMYQKAGEAIAKSLERELIKLDAAKQLSKYSKQQHQPTTTATARHDSNPRAGSTATDLAGGGGDHHHGGGRSASPPTIPPDALRRVSIGSTSSSRPGTQTTTIAIEDLRALVSRSKHAGLENTQELLQIQRMVENAMELRFKVHFDSNIRLLSVPQEQVVSTPSEARNAVSAGSGAAAGASGRLSSMGNNKRGSSPSLSNNNKRSNSRPQSGGSRLPVTNPTHHHHNAHHYAPPSFDRLFDKVYRFCIQGLTGVSAQASTTQLPPDNELATPQTVNFRMRYQDTDGDFILLTSEEDWKVLLSDHYSGAYHQVAAAATGRAGHGGGGKSGTHQRIELYCDIPAQPRQGPPQPPPPATTGVSTPTGNSPGQQQQQQQLPPRSSNSGGGNKIVRNGFVPTTTPLKANGINVLNHAPPPSNNDNNPTSSGVAVEYHGPPPRRSSSSHGSSGAAGKGAIDTGKIKGALSKGIQGTQLLPTSSSSGNNNNIQNQGADGAVGLDSYYQNREDDDPEFQLPSELSPAQQHQQPPPHRGGESPVAGVAANNRKFSFTVASAPTSKQQRGGSNAKSHDDASSAASSKPSPSRPTVAVAVARSAEGGNRGTWADNHNNDDELDLHTVLSDNTDNNTAPSVARDPSPSIITTPAGGVSNNNARKVSGGGRSGSSTYTTTTISPPLSTNTVNLLGGNNKKTPVVNAWSNREADDDTLELHTVLSERTGGGGGESSSSPSRLAPPPRQRATSSSVSPPMSTGTVKLAVGGKQHRGSAWVSNTEDDNDFDLHTITSEVSIELQEIGDRRRQIVAAQQKSNTSAPLPTSSAAKKQPLQAALPVTKKVSPSAASTTAPTEAKSQQQQQKSGGLREADLGALRPKTWVDDHADNADFDLHTVASIETTGTQAWRKDILAQAIEVEAELQRMEKNARGNNNNNGSDTPTTAKKGGPSEIGPPVNIRKNIPVPGIPLASNHQAPKRQQQQQDAYSFPAKNNGGGESSSSSVAINLAVQGKHPGSGSSIASSSTAAEGSNGNSSPPKKKKLSMAEVNIRRAELLAQIRKQKQEQDAATASK